MINKLILISISLLFYKLCFSQDKKENYSLEFVYSKLKGLEPEKGVTRRDPSDIILVDNKYYVWYTKTKNDFSGYNASIWYAVSYDGDTWQEQGEALPRGQSGSWDSYSVFTPNILAKNKQYYLFYTAVKPTPGNPEKIFENNSTNDITAIGVAISNSPDGTFKRISNNPVLEVSNKEDNFDSYRVDDACIVFRNGKYYMYYKGRSLKHGQKGPRHTKMGVAISQNPEGPYIKYEKNPITNGGHEVMVWLFKNGMMTMLSEHGPQGRSIQFSKDGLNFSVVGKMSQNYPKAPGYFRFDNFDDVRENQNISWGISMFYGDMAKNIWPHLLKYQVKINLSQNEKSKDIYNKKIVLGKSVGSIKAGMTLDNLKSIYGDKNIKQIIYDYEEDMPIYGTEIIFPNKKNNIIVLWDYQEKVDKIIIRDKESEWNVMGLKIGSPISLVQKLNQSKFIIYGYEIDRYLAGTVKNWQGGKFKNLRVKFELTKAIKYEKMGDVKETYISDDNIILEAEPIISKIFLSFDNLD